MSTNAADIIKTTSDRLHNKNCCSYLKKLNLSESVLKALPSSMAEQLKIVQQHNYDPNVAYADLYTQFFSYVEENIEQLYDKRRANLVLSDARIKEYEKTLANSDAPLVKDSQQFMRYYRKQLGDTKQINQEIQALDDFIFSIYNNENSILEDTFEVIKKIPLSHTLVDSGIEKSISQYLKDDDNQRINKAKSPAQAGSLFGRFFAMISDNFKPQHDTSLAAVRLNAYNKPSENNPAPVTEYRIGTQGQRHHGVARVSPLFERWLQVKATRTGNEKITHIYFNNLGLDRNDTEGKKERDLTKVLHKLEDQHHNIAVITLPADKGLMSKGEYRKTEPRHSYQDVYDDFLSIATQKSKRKTKDFFISDKVRQLLFKNVAEEDQMKFLLTKSFKAMGFEEDATLSSAQRQAVWFHFIKFELTNYIIKTLEPESINFSCKDAIDRGGVSSAYYNLLESFRQEKPLSREEFERALHAAPAMVKARGMNHHLKLIWNAVDAYINANYETLRSKKDQAWLIEWRDANCPHSRVQHLLEQRVEQSIDELNKAKGTLNKAKTIPLKEINIQENAIKKGLEILNQIKAQVDIGVSGKRLLLEAASRTPDIVLHPNKENRKDYIRLADKLASKYPALQILGGMMKTLAGIALYLPSFGHTKQWIDKGLASVKAGVESNERKALQRNMKEHVNSLREPELSESQEPSIKRQ
ncbi:MULTISPECIES: hypothetical protein [unclassified Legionella]|uniref:hypothetical protein n=1 Tax=unclassified Legionella TaxID=2622702 RepID=UPI001054C91F|nr:MULTISPECIES: hypothetical protein [unclassified Legionella]MDI9818409.1 hypothetical protein [Legionella sp. PL877]